MYSRTADIDFRVQENRSQIKLATASVPTVSSNPLQRSTLHHILTNLISSCFSGYVHHCHPHQNWLYVLRYPWQIRLVLSALSMIVMIRLPLHCDAVGYSYARFTGPVSGPEREILVRDAISHGSRVDYIAHPEYQFAYGVEDSETRVLQNHKESRNGDEVKGVYSVVEPDGTLRVVKYSADDMNGFQAEVIRNGIPTIYGRNSNNEIVQKDGIAADWHVETGSNADGNKHEGENEGDEYNENSFDGEGNSAYDEDDPVEEYEEAEENNANVHSDESDYY